MPDDLSRVFWKLTPVLPGDDSVYVSWCHRCGEENRQIGQEVKCKNCGAEYYLDWPGQAAK